MCNTQSGLVLHQIGHALLLIDGQEQTGLVYVVDLRVVRSPRVDCPDHSTLFFVQSCFPCTLQTALPMCSRALCFPVVYHGRPGCVLISLITCRSPSLPV